MLDDYEVYVFDFDGTIIDSVKIKYDAFFTVFEDYGVSDIVSNTLMEFPDLNRLGLIGKVINSAKLNLCPQETSSCYSKIVEEELRICSFIPFAIESLKLLKDRKEQVYLSSNTPEDALDRIVDIRQLRSYFNGIFGVPHIKSNTVENLLRKHNIAPKKLLVIGDGDSDQECAKLNGCSFYRVFSDRGLKNFFAS